MDVRGSRFKFVNDPALKGLVDEGLLLALGKWGAYVRRTARQSMKRRARPSPPGQPPSVHEGSVKRLLNFYYDTHTKTVVVGPEIKPMIGTGAPHTLEFGGRVQVRPKIHKPFEVGEVGPVREIPGKDGKVRLVWAKLKSDKMVDRANNLWKASYYRRFKDFYVEPRPFMVPAMVKNLKVVPACFASCIRGY